MGSIAVLAYRVRRLELGGAYGRETEGRKERRPMPYSNVSDLPTEQVDQYSTHQKHAFLKAFDNAYSEYHGDEGRAFATAHAAAQRAPEREPDRKQARARSS